MSHEEDTFHSRVLGLFQPPKRKEQRGAEIGLPNYLGKTFMIPASDVDTSPISTKREALEQYNGWIFPAAGFIAEEVRALDWNLWLRTRVRREEWEIDDRHAFNDILEQPNSDQDWGDFIELTDLHYSISGEFYWHIIRSGAQGRPIGMEVIYPHWVQEPVVRDGRMVAWKVVKPGGTPRELPAQDVIRVHRPHPLNHFAAASPVEAAAVSHFLDLYTRAYGMTLLRNDAGIPAGMLTSNQRLTDAQAEALKARWKERYRNTRDEIMVGGDSTRFQPIGIPIRDLRMLEISELSRDQVLSMFRVSPALLGMVQDHNRTNLEAAMFGFQRFTLRGRAMRIEQTIRRKVMPVFMGREQARRYWWGFEDVVSKDQDRERAEANDMLTKGSITINEYREKMGMSALEGHGDVFMVPSGFSLKDTLEPGEPLDLTPGGNNDDDEEDEEEDDEEQETMAARFTAARERDRSERFRRQLRRREERDQTSIIRGEFAKWRRRADLHGVPYIDPDWLERHGIEPERVRIEPGESIVDYYERLKSTTAREIAREIADREVPA